MVPRDARDHGEGDPLVRVADLRVHFPFGRARLLSRTREAVRAVDGVSLAIERGETLGLVGESGCGKSTLGRAILRVYPPTSGSVAFDGIDLAALSSEQLRHLRRRMQMVFQDPYSSLDPRMTAGSIVGEALDIHRLAKGTHKTRRVAQLLGLVGLSASAMKRYPHEFSGGQRQRIGVARALAVEPEFLVADEPVSALDVSIQAQLINLLKDLQAEFHLTFLFIAHDLAIVAHVSDRVAVMYLGRVVEIAGRRDLYQRPLHPYTQALLSAVPIPDPVVEARRERIILTGDVPSAVHPPSGCRFRTRCQLRQRLGDPEICTTTEPALEERAPGHAAACHFVDTMAAEPLA